MDDQDHIEALVTRSGFDDFRWLAPADIPVAHWVRMKCRFGCPEYGKNACCPPFTPPVDVCARFFGEYRRALVVHCAKRVPEPAQRHAWTRQVNEGLAGLERGLFLGGYPKAFVLFLDSCGLCGACAGHPDLCEKPHQARPSPEAMAVDVFTMVRQVGYTIEVLPDIDREMDRFALLLVD